MTPGDCWVYKDVTRKLGHDDVLDNDDDDDHHHYAVVDENDDDESR